MDPYLEGSLWRGVHGQLISEIVRQLTPVLRPRYFALLETRFVRAAPGAGEEVAISAPPEAPDPGLYPDAAVATRGPLGGGAGVTQSGATTVAPLTLNTVMPVSLPLRTVKIRDAANRQLVAAIELLSPWNKRGDGRKEYLRRRRRWLFSAAHLIEIDLLRRGRRVPMVDPLPAAPYFAFVGRAGRRPATDVWPIALDRPLPTIPVPLLPGDADAPLDLQRLLTSVYDQAGFDLIVDYARPPEDPLAAPDQAWAADLLRNRQGS